MPYSRHHGLCLGQERFLASFQHAAHIGNLPHAWILTGPMGVGKRTTFYHLARFLLAQGTENAQDEKALDKQIATQSHPELLVLEAPVSVEVIRQVRSRLAQTSWEVDSWRVVGLMQAHLLNLSGLNALLKILEDPPARTIFILTAPSAQNLPWTVRSRCMVQPIYPLNAVAFPVALKQLAKAVSEFEMPSLPEHLDFFGQLAQGCLGRGMRLGEGKRMTHAEALWKDFERTVLGYVVPDITLVQFFAQDMPFFKEILFLWIHEQLCSTASKEGIFKQHGNPVEWQTTWNTCQNAILEHYHYNTDAQLLIYQIFAILTAS